MSQPLTEETETREQQLLRQARRAFEKHVVRSSNETHGRWLLQRPYGDGKGWSSTFAVEILCLWGGQLFVGGDIDHVLFAYYSDNQRPRSRVRWMGQCRDFGYYVAQKARSGSGREITEEYDETDAKESLEHLYKTAQEENWEEEILEDLKDVIDNMPSSREELIQALWHDGNIPHDVLGDMEPLGMVLSTRVYYAWAALERLCNIWNEGENAASGTAGNAETVG